MEAKVKSTFFYTEEQTSILKQAIFRGDNLKDAAARYAAQWDKRRQNVLVKLYNLKKEMQGEVAADKQPSEREQEIINKITPKTSVKVNVASPEQGIELPEGFVFTGTPKKVTLFKDHFRVYF